ncbi:MAG: glucosamine-6-phosphate deaminase [Saprospiraceae bacterium]
MSQKGTKKNLYPSVLSYQIHNFEKNPAQVFSDAEEGSIYVARKIADAIKKQQSIGEHIVLGLATGSSPIKVYAELIRIHKEEHLSFSNVITFNLDEYYPIQHDQQQSYHHFMNEYLFDFLDIPESNINIPSGKVALEKLHKYCLDYEEKIKSLGGLDIQLLGIGRSGHIGFNEPGSSKSSTTRLVRLNAITRHDAGDDFLGKENVPYKAITMGVKSILEAKEIFVLAWGQHKAEVVKKALEGPVSSEIPSTFLQEHAHCEYILDEAAASRLTKVEMPWLVGSCLWDEGLVRKAVIWLSDKAEKPILKLTEEDYEEHGLAELLLKVDNAYKVNISVFNQLQRTITGWPGGKPKSEGQKRPERAMPESKRIIIFSPHPDDDVISMGGTFLRLVEQGHDVHVAYQTSGNIAVHDHDVERFIEFFEDYYEENENKICDYIALIKAKKVLQSDLLNKNTEEVRKLKGLIRKGEARTAAKFCGLQDSNIHFLNLPFYETGSVKKNGPTDIDWKITADLIETIKPHQIFAAGDLADPHGTHRICLDIILEALKQHNQKQWIADCWLWLYRGAWHEFAIDEIEMAVPISPKELMKKRKAIFMHQSQKDSAPFPGEDSREFWQRSEDRNKITAQQYRSLGLAEYEAMEAFKRWIY